MPAKVRDIIKKVEKAGWVQVPGGGKGSHRKYKHPTKVGMVVIPGQLSDDLAPGTEASIRKAAGI